MYRYGTSSAFPNQTFNSSNYWVDVVFEPGPPPTLNSISVTPANPNIATGATQQFTATGTYSDGSTQNLTSQVTWTSSNTSVATINSAGLASGATPGSTTITAAFSGTPGLTTLTVQATPLTITTSSLPNGVLNLSYSATLAGSGGTPPYSWSLESGNLPTGLSLSSSGTISGTPTVAGSYNFTVRLSDSAAQLVTKALSIAVNSSASMTIWSSSTVPGVVDSGPDSAVQLGVKFRSDVAGTIRGIRFYKAAGNTGTHVGSLWSSSGTRLANATFTNETASGWQEVLFATPVAISANTVYVASYHTTSGHYSLNTNYFASTGADNATTARSCQRRLRRQMGFIDTALAMPFPEPDLERLQLLGGCSFPAKLKLDVTAPECKTDSHRLGRVSGRSSRSGGLFAQSSNVRV